MYKWNLHDDTIFLIKHNNQLTWSKKKLMYIKFKALNIFWYIFKYILKYPQKNKNQFIVFELLKKDIQNKICLNKFKVIWF